MAFSLVERPEARYRVVYGRHDRITPASELPSEYDALFLEGIPWRHSQADLGDGCIIPNLDQYSEIVENAQEKDAKIYFGDVPLKKFPIKIRGKRLLPSWASAIRLGEFYASLGLAALLTVEIGRSKQISRRDFLKMIGKGTAAAWGTSWITKFGDMFFREGQEVPRILEKMTAAEDPIHPEDIAIWFRNAIVAKKLITIGKKGQAELNRKAELAIVFGKAHTGLAGFLRQGEEACKKVVRLYPQWFLKTMVAEGNLENISLIVETKYNPQYDFWMISDRFIDEGLYFSVNREQEYSSLKKEIR